MKLEDCPWCGAGDIHTANNNREFFWCVCGWCGAKGPIANSEIDATKAWNDRERCEECWEREQ